MVATQYPSQALSFRRAFYAMLGITLALLLSALDQTVIGNILPAIVTDLNGFSLYSWVATGYMLTSMITIPVFGRLGDLYGRKHFVLWAIVIFVVASLICATATDMWWLIFGRAMQGIGGGMLLGAGLACVPELFPDTRERLRWQILLNLVFSVGNAIGPVAGGWLTQTVGWRYVFWVNLPIGIVAFIMVGRYLPYMAVVREKDARVDWMGALWICTALVSMQLLVEFLPDRRAYSAAALAACIVSFALLAKTERRAPSPFLPAALFKGKHLQLLFVLATLSGVLLFGLLLYLPLLFQAGFGYPPAYAGLLMLPFAVSSSIGSIASGRLLTWMRRPHHLPRVGFIILTLSTLALASTTRNTSAPLIMILTAAAGTGLGFVLLNLTIFTQSIADKAILGIATAFQKSLRLVGGLLGTAIIGSAVTALYTHEVRVRFASVAQSAYSTRFYNPRVLLGGPELLAIPAGLREQLVILARGALQHALTQGLLLIFAVGLLSTWIIFLVPPINLIDRSTTR